MTRGRILIVDDEKLIRWSIRKRLEEQRYVVAEAEDGLQTSRLLEGKSWDVVLLDCRLPDTTGEKILALLRKCAPETTVVMMTAYGTSERAVEAMRLGAFDYLTKPVNLEELVVTVQKALEMTALRREVRRLRGECRKRPRSAESGGGMREMPAPDTDMALPVGVMSLDEIEREAIAQALERSNYNQVRAAKLLGVSRDTLRYRMKKYGLLTHAHA